MLGRGESQRDLSPQIYVGVAVEKVIGKIAAQIEGDEGHQALEVLQILGGGKTCLNLDIDLVGIERGVEVTAAKAALVVVLASPEVGPRGSKNNLILGERVESTRIARTIKVVGTVETTGTESRKIEKEMLMIKTTRTQKTTEIKTGRERRRKRRIRAEIIGKIRGLVLGKQTVTRKAPSD